eukprot:GHVT01007129.1.p2 GENE.GHVT01007129.1~~GHVT01007129.1.p2  ORF type:complete len:127 (+),score=19.29 GHVT01007129.1:1072-1452(+)
MQPTMSRGKLDWHSMDWSSHRWLVDLPSGINDMSGPALAAEASPGTAKDFISDPTLSKILPRLAVVDNPPPNGSRRSGTNIRASNSIFSWIADEASGPARVQPLRGKVLPMRAADRLANLAGRAGR